MEPDISRPAVRTPGPALAGPNTGSRWTLLLCAAAALLALLAWATHSPLDQVSRARAQFIANARTQVVQASADGVVDALTVSEGAAVTRGQLLVQLDRTQAVAAVSDSRAKVAALRATLARLQAEVQGRPLVFPADLHRFPTFVDNQQNLYDRRRDALSAELASLQKGLDLTREELSLVEALVRTRDVGRAELIRLQKQESDLAGQITGKRNRFFQEAQEALTKAEEDLSTQSQLLAEREVLLDRMQIAAPADGLVRNMQITTPGARVRPGEVIMELLPTGGKLILEARLGTADIARIRVGGPVQVKLDAFDYTVHGTLKGQITYVSPDALTDRRPQGDESYYRVHVELDGEHLRLMNDRAREDRRVQIQAGMWATVEFIVGRQTVFEYLAKPIIKASNEALRER